MTQTSTSSTFCLHYAIRDSFGKVSGDYKKKQAVGVIPKACLIVYYFQELRTPSIPKGGKFGSSPAVGKAGRGINQATA